MEKRLVNLTGQRFGRWVVIGEAISQHRDECWHCRCDCGTERDVIGYHLKSGASQSCGCLRKERTSAATRKHGLGNTRLYSIWRGMKDRCYRKTHTRYNQYGGRGITVCDEWLHNFQVFYDWAISNGYSDTLTIDRIDNNKGYFPENCHWISVTAQNNNRRSNHLITINGESHNITEWSKITGVPSKNISKRLYLGWSPAEALGLELKEK